MMCKRDYATALLILVGWQMWLESEFRVQRCTMGYFTISLIFMLTKLLKNVFDNRNKAEIKYKYYTVKQMVYWEINVTNNKAMTSNIKLTKMLKTHERINV